ncbi:hypothetical protein L1887_38931 [Cichorium endivia]|nr:hypothetical protein L1887_38931 [Cichorium endivia]
MERSRLSSRLCENFKWKFKNTSEARYQWTTRFEALLTRSVNTLGTKEEVADECQISKNKDGSEGSKTKFTKNTASRLAQDQPKGMTIGGQQEVTKNQDERVNKGKSVAETSGAKMGKMKVIEKSKKRKGVEKDSNKSFRKDKSAKGNEVNPQVKRPKLGKVEGQKKVIEIGSSSKPSEN